MSEEANLSPFDLDWQQRNLAFLQRQEVERPLLACTWGSYFPLEMFPAGAASLPQGYLQPDMIRVEAFLPDYERYYRFHQEAADDVPWVAAPFLGIPWTEAILGCPVAASSETIWSEPYVQDWDQVADLAFSPDNPWVQKLREFMTVLGEYSGGRFPVGTTLMRGPSDMLAALRGHTNLALDLYDCPDKVARAAELVTDIFIHAMKAQLELATGFGGGYCSGYIFRLWAPQKCAWNQSDTAAFLSPRFYRQLILPHDQRIAQSVDYCFFHLHPPALYAADALVDVPEVSVIEVNVDYGGPTATDMIPTFAKIQQRKPLVIWGRLREEDLENILTNLSPRGLCLAPIVDSVEEAKAIKRRLERGL